jgi:Cof subfamily protein (haloacid dehalogenase superfamily)
MIQMKVFCAEFIKPRRDLKLLALDMDGTLLDSNSKILDSSVEAIKLALERQVQVILATGKARPAAIAAMEKVGLAGEGLVVSKTSAGIFLQGLAVYGPTGELVDGGTLEMDVVALVLRYAMEKDVGVCGFLGETCITPKMTTEIESLHSRYYEPLATIQPSVEQILSGPKIRKLLLMADSSTISNEIRPELEKKLRDTGATPVQAVDTMLEIVPRGWNKWRGMQGLLKHWEIPAEQVMAIGDGENDLELIKGVGLGVAMGNAVPLVKDVAKHVVSGNDMHGVAEAIEKYIL